MANEFTSTGAGADVGAEAVALAARFPANHASVSNAGLPLSAAAVGAASEPEDCFCKSEAANKASVLNTCDAPVSAGAGSGGGAPAANIAAMSMSLPGIGAGASSAGAAV